MNLLLSIFSVAMSVMVQKKLESPIHGPPCDTISTCKLKTDTFNDCSRDLHITFNYFISHGYHYCNKGVKNEL